jgi:hypothetical protein
VNYNFIQKIFNTELLSIVGFEKNQKCKVCVDVKFTKTCFRTVKRSNEHLDLIHNHIGD